MQSGSGNCDDHDHHDDEEDAYKSGSDSRMANQSWRATQSGVGKIIQLAEEEKATTSAAAATALAVQEGRGGGEEAGEGQEEKEEEAGGEEEAGEEEQEKERVGRIEMKKLELILILALMAAAIVCSVGASRVAEMIYFANHLPAAPVYSASRSTRLSSSSGSGSSSSSSSISNNNSSSSSGSSSRSKGSHSSRSYEQVATVVWLDGERLEAPWLTRSEPKWMDACNKRQTREEALVNVILRPLQRHPSHPIEEEPRTKQARFIKALEGVTEPPEVAAPAGERLPAAANKWPTTTSAKSTKEQRRRRKRSAPTDGASLEAKRWAALLKRRRPHSSSTLTGGRVGATLLAWQQQQQQSGYHKRHKAARIRFFHSGNTNVYTSSAHELGSSAAANVNLTGVSGSSTPQIQKPPTTVWDNDDALYELVETISSTDIRIAWYVNRALNTAASLKRALQDARQKMEASAAKGNSLDDEQVISSTSVGNLINGHLEDEHRKWLPSLSSLSRKNHQPPAMQPNETYRYPSLMLANVSHYIQYFSVAFEQMVFEQVNLDKRLCLAYRQLERATQRMICDVESLIGLLVDTQKHELRLSQVIEQIKRIPLEEALKRRSFSILLTLERQPKYTFDTINSPYLADSSLSTNFSSSSIVEDLEGSRGSKSDPQFIYVSRQVMPLSQRLVRSPVRRNMRDRYILKDFEALIAFYESVLTHIYAPYKRKTANQQQQQQQPHHHHHLEKQQSSQAKQQLQ